MENSCTEKIKWRGLEQVVVSIDNTRVENDSSKTGCLVETDGVRVLNVVKVKNKHPGLQENKHAILCQKSGDTMVYLGVSKEVMSFSDLKATCVFDPRDYELYFTEPEPVWKGYSVSSLKITTTNQKRIDWVNKTGYVFGLNWNSDEVDILWESNPGPCPRYNLVVVPWRNELYTLYIYSLDEEFSWSLIDYSVYFPPVFEYNGLLVTEELSPCNKTRGCFYVYTNTSAIGPSDERLSVAFDACNLACAKKGDIVVILKNIKGVDYQLFSVDFEYLDIENMSVPLSECEIKFPLRFVDFYEELRLLRDRSSSSSSREECHEDNRQKTKKQRIDFFESNKEEFSFWYDMFFKDVSDSDRLYAALRWLNEMETNKLSEKINELYKLVERTLKGGIFMS